jgi:glyoxylase-like metal-dependent hydrolase (beta-lactamase superfamily II)
MSAADRVLAIRFASTSGRRSTTYLRYDLHHLPDADAPCAFWVGVIESPAGEVALMDTGFTRRTAEQRGIDMHVDVLDGLAMCGITPADVRLVVLSHLHWDHVGHLGDFGEATVVLQAAEDELWTGPLARRTQFAAMADPTAIKALDQVRAEGRLRLVEGDALLWPGARLRALPGHTPGSQGLEIDTTSGPVLMTGDALHFAEQLYDDLLFKATADVVAQLRTLDRLAQLRGEGITILPGHDAGILASMPPVAIASPDVLDVVEWMANQRASSK